MLKPGMTARSIAALLLVLAASMHPVPAAETVGVRAIAAAAPERGGPLAGMIAGALGTP